ncbi:hypothetical protein MVEN_00182400 [Mycena venus]|uniref:Uncharacterized protein n=1 Tax=Mycena venus TaxID=2733690 RepID=A0A8H6Z0V3_9AGAR|nr:hypothetical protein MVEN_00182400 [Mycena venus]
MPSLTHLLVFAVLSSVVVATPFRHSGPEFVARASSHPTTDLLCLAFNLNTNTTEDGSPLTRASATSQTLLECHYSDGEVCSYLRGNGSIQTGSSMCPKSIDPSKSTESAGFDCNQHHLQNSPLIGSSVTPTAGNLACVYADATLCTYSQHTGTLSTGASLCPITATGSPECPVSSSGPTPNTGSTKVAAAIRSSSDTSSALSPRAHRPPRDQRPPRPRRTRARRGVAQALARRCGQAARLEISRAPSGDRVDGAE